MNLQKKVVSLAVAISFFVLPITQVFATESLNEGIEHTEIELAEELAEEGLELEDTTLDIVEEKYTIEVSDENGNVSNMEIEMGANKIVSEVVTGEGTENYDIVFPEDANIDSENLDEELDFSIIDTDTEEVFESEDLEGELSWAIAIPIGIPLVWGALVSLFKAGLTVIAWGMTFIAAGSVISKIRNNKKKKNHYLAVVNKKGLFIGPGVTEAAAINTLRAGRSTWSISSNQAKKIASKLAKGKPINEVDKNAKTGSPKTGYYWHWHSSNRKPKGHHAFYGTAVR